MNAKIANGKQQLWQWDTGVQLMLFDVGTANKLHFDTPDGVISRDIVDGLCDIPDAVLQRAGTMVCYAFRREVTGGDTRHEYRFVVLPRPKPADYIDPPDEMDNLDQLAERVAGLIGPGSGGGDGVLIVNITTEDGETYAADKTYAELTEALTAGQMLYACFVGNIYAPLVVLDDGYTFSVVVSENGPLAECTGRILSDDTVSVSLGVVGGFALVNITSEDGVTFTADKTVAELYEASTAGQPVYARLEGAYAPAQLVSSDMALFRIQLPDGTIAVTMDSDNSVTVEIVEDVASYPLVVKYVSMNSDGTFLMNHTSTEIVEAVEAGRSVYAYTGNSIMPLERIDSGPSCVFDGGIQDISNGQLLKTQLRVEGTKGTFIENYINTINPHPLVIDGVEYDGSERVEVEVVAASSGAVLLTDSETGVQYKLGVTNGKLTMEEVVEE